MFVCIDILSSVCNQLMGCNENDFAQQCAHQRVSVHIADHRTVCRCTIGTKGSILF